MICQSFLGDDISDGLNHAQTEVALIAFSDFHCSSPADYFVDIQWKGMVVFADGDADLAAEGRVIMCLMCLVEVLRMSAFHDIVYHESRDCYHFRMNCADVYDLFHLYDDNSTVRFRGTGDFRDFQIHRFFFQGNISFFISISAAEDGRIERQRLIPQIFFAVQVGDIGNPFFAVLCQLIGERLRLFSHP